MEKMKTKNNLLKWACGFQMSVPEDFNGCFQGSCCCYLVKCELKINVLVTDVHSQEFVKLDISVKIALILTYVIQDLHLHFKICQQAI